MVALNFNHAVFNRAAGTACLFELFGEFPEIIVLQRNSGDHSNSLPPTSFRFPPKPYDAVAFWNRFLLPAEALCNGLAASGAHLTMYG